MAPLPADIREHRRKLIVIHCAKGGHLSRVSATENADRPGESVKHHSDQPLRIPKHPLGIAEGRRQSVQTFPGRLVARGARCDKNRFAGIEPLLSDQTKRDDNGVSRSTRLARPYDQFFHLSESFSRRGMLS